ncbi:MAG: hypothetical protein ABF246_03110 [Winogradskyella sp.]
MKVGSFIINADGSATMVLADPINSGGYYTSGNPPSDLEFQLPTNVTLLKL